MIVDAAALYLSEQACDFNLASSASVTVLGAAWRLVVAISNPAKAQDCLRPRKPCRNGKSGNARRETVSHSAPAGHFLEE